jgi:hypothetical protein
VSEVSLHYTVAKPKAMKTRYPSLFLLCLLPFTEAKACVDYWTPPSITVTVHYNAMFTEALVVVSNLSLFGGPNGAFCSCAVTTVTDNFSDLRYVAFVDSGTYQPVAGFAPWEANVSAGSAWGALQPGDWNGFIAEVVGPGISTGTPVELLIRAALPPGASFNSLDSTITYSALGTDEWSPLDEELTFSHNSLGYLGQAASIVFIEEPDAFFDLVDGIVLSVDRPAGTSGDLLVMRRDGGAIIAWPGREWALELRVHDAAGRLIVQRNWDGSPLLLDGYPAGLLVVEVRGPAERIVRKVPVW